MVDTPELERILNRIHEWTRAADMKAYILVLIQTAVPSILAGSLKEWYTDPGMMPYRFPVLLATIGWLGSLVLSSLAILARTGWRGRKSVTYFGSIETWKLEAYRHHLAQLSTEDLRDDFVDQIWICARICSLKHFFVKFANYAFLVSSALIVGCYVYRALKG